MSRAAVMIAVFYESRRQKTWNMWFARVRSIGACHVVHHRVSFALLIPTRSTGLQRYNGEFASPVPITSLSSLSPLSFHGGTRVTWYICLEDWLRDSSVKPIHYSRYSVVFIYWHEVPANGVTITRLLHQLQSYHIPLILFNLLASIFSRGCYSVGYIGRLVAWEEVITSISQSFPSIQSVVFICSRRDVLHSTATEGAVSIVRRPAGLHTLVVGCCLLARCVARKRSASSFHHLRRN